MKKILIIFGLMFVQHTTYCQNLYCGLNGGFDGAGIPAAAPLNLYNSFEIKLGWRDRSDTAKWQYEISCRQTDIYNSYVNSVVCLPLVLRYNLPFMFIRSGYTSILAERIFDARGYITRQKKYSPGWTASIGIEKNVMKMITMNLQYNLTTSLDSWAGDSGRPLYYKDIGFLLELQYHFMK